MQSKPAAVLMFAAGFGTRMKPLTDTCPKPLIAVAGQSLIDHATALVTDYGIPRIVVNLHYRSEMIREHLAGTNMQFSEEQPEILDT